MYAQRRICRCGTVAANITVTNISAAAAAVATIFFRSFLFTVFFSLRFWNQFSENIFRFNWLRYDFSYDIFFFNRTGGGRFKNLIQEKNIRDIICNLQLVTMKKHKKRRKFRRSELTDKIWWRNEKKTTHPNK